MLLSQNVLITSSKDVIAIRYIECWHLDTDESDQCVDKLAGDMVIPVTMTSGKCYRISIKDQIQSFKDNGMPSDLISARTAIFDKWVYLIGNVNGNTAS